MFKYIADRLFFLYRFCISIVTLIFILLKYLIIIFVNIVKLLFKAINIMIGFCGLVIIKVAIIFWLGFVYFTNIVLNVLILCMIFIKNFFIVLWEIILFIIMSVIYVFNIFFYGIKKLFSLEDTILPTNYFLKDIFYSFMFHINNYKHNVRYIFHALLHKFDLLKVTLIESWAYLSAYIYLKRLQLINDIILLKGTSIHMYLSIKHIKYEKPKLNLVGMGNALLDNLKRTIKGLINYLNNNYRKFIIFFGKIPFAIAVFVYKIIFNGILFIIHDLVKIKYLYFYAKTYKFKAISVSLIMGFNLFALIFFYNNFELFKKQSTIWSDRLSFHNVSVLIVSIAENELLQSIKYQKIQIEVAQDETLSQILLERYDVDPANVNLVVSKIRSAFNLKVIKPSWVINTVLVSGGAFDKNQIKRISIPISNVYDLVVEADSNNEYKAFKQQKKLTRYIFRRRILISDSFYKSANKVGVPDGVIDSIYKVLSWDVDFQRDIKNGDVLELVYECLYNQLNELTSCDSPLYAFLNGAQKTVTLYKYADGYYNSDGQSAAKTLIKTPINGARLNSNFGIRTHPVLGYAVFHKGIDFAAVIGTPILASGSGVVEKKYYSDTYGNYLKIRHNEYLSSAYAHMNGFHVKIKEGEKVLQGQIIGYVGATGRVTGPHLHYEVLIKDKQINPLILYTPPDKVLKDDKFDEFLQYQDMLSKVIIRIPTKEKILSPFYDQNEEVQNSESLNSNSNNI